METSQLRCSDLRAWNAIAVRTFGEIEIDSGAGCFEGALTTRDWPGLRIVNVASTPACVHGGGARQRPGWFLLYNRGGLCVVRQAGRRAELDDGELSLVRADEPYDIGFERPNRMCVVALPLLDAPAALNDRVAVRHDREQSEVVAALLQRLQRIDAGAAALLEPVTLRRALVDLVALARPVDQRERAPAPNRRPRELVARLEALVSRHLADPDLDAAALGRALGVSPRYVQMLFARQGTTAGAHILEQRLQFAARLLRERADRVADVAMQAGFGDLSHFCRSFRRRFGCTASDWRAAR